MFHLSAKQPNLPCLMTLLQINTYLYFSLLFNYLEPLSLFFLLPSLSVSLLLSQSLSVSLSISSASVFISPSIFLSMFRILTLLIDSPHILLPVLNSGGRVYTTINRHRSYSRGCFHGSHVHAEHDIWVSAVYISS